MAAHHSTAARSFMSRLQRREETCEHRVCFYTGVLWGSKAGQYPWFKTDYNRLRRSATAQPVSRLITKQLKREMTVVFNQLILVSEISVLNDSNKITTPKLQNIRDVFLILSCRQILIIFSFSLELICFRLWGCLHVLFNFVIDI